MLARQRPLESSLVRFSLRLLRSSAGHRRQRRQLSKARREVQREIAGAPLAQ
jgi:hypothetical protein